MSHSHSEQSILVKVLTLTGMFATTVFVLWLGVQAIKFTPTAFSSLATMAKSVQDYRPLNELKLTTEKKIVNSAESFQISWTDVHQDGEYRFSYTCTKDASLLVRGGDGDLVPIKCNEVLSLPATVHGLFLSIKSEGMRFTDVPLKLSFKGKKNNTTLESELEVTVVNASIPTTQETPRSSNEPEVTKPVTTTKPTAPKPPVATAPVTAPKPVTTIVYPESNPQGMIDLKVTTLGSGILTNGVFSYTPTYDEDETSAIRFDIKNIGTKTSDSWTFTTTLPGGQKYTSDVQSPLKPNEHVEFTMGFALKGNDNLVKISTTVKTRNDVNAKNDTSDWSVAVD